MATHKVPQDVEADDKLLGPFSLKQFIFIVLAIGFGWLTFFFFTQVHPLAAIIWLPPTLFFGILGGYQRKDQPVEVYLASAIRFYTKPRKRKWDQEGYDERVKVTAPPKVEHNYTKPFSGEEAFSRLSNLSRMMDSRGWASKMASDWQNPQLEAIAVGGSDRLVSAQDVASASVQPMSAQSFVRPVDVMDDQTSIVAQQFSTRLSQMEDAKRLQAVQMVQQARQDSPTFQKYPSGMRQKVISPEGNQPTTSVQTAPQPQPEKSEPSEPSSAQEPSPLPTEDSKNNGTVEVPLR